LNLFLSLSLLRWFFIIILVFIYFVVVVVVVIIVVVVRCSLFNLFANSYYCKKLCVAIVAPSIVGCSSRQLSTLQSRIWPICAYWLQYK
jgi:hypothetical protein